MDEEIAAIVIDNGTGMCKVGFSGEEKPKSVFPAVVGRLKNKGMIVGSGGKSYYVGHDAQEKRGLLNLKYPIKHGSVNDWDEMETIWHYAIQNKLQVNSEDHPVMVTESPMNAKANRERMTQVLFESFNVPSMYVQLQAVLALYSSGRTTGIVLDSGHGVTHSVPIYDGYAIMHAIQRVDLAGFDLTEFLAIQLKNRGHSFNSSAEKEIVRDIKEKFCYVSSNYLVESIELEHEHKTKSYELPDGNIIKMGSEMVKVPEALFQPAVMGMDEYYETAGIHKRLYGTILECDIDLRKDLYSNIVLSGGTTLFPGFQERLSKELRTLIPNVMKINVVAPDDRGLSIWIGGAILASLASFRKLWVTREEYDENGPTIVHRKCL